MKVLVISTSLSGSKTIRATKQFYQTLLAHSNDESEIRFINLAEKEMAFSDGRHYLDYKGDTGEVLQSMMDSDLIIIATPIYQASIAGSLKNLFDLLPTQAFNRKVVGLIITAGSPRHYLVGETQIIPVLHYMYASVIPKYVYITDNDFKADGSVSDEIEFRFQALAEDALLTVETFQELWQRQDEQYGF